MMFDLVKDCFFNREQKVMIVILMCKKTIITINPNVDRINK